MLSPLIRNPFLEITADHTVGLPQGDVPELHQEIFRRYQAAISEVRQIGQGVGVLTVGEAGSGKSHLIARLRREVDEDPRAALVTLRLRTGSLGNLWRPVRQQLFEELLRPLPHNGSGENGLLRILRNRFPQWAAAQQEAGGVLAWLLGRSRRADLKPHLDQFGRTCPLFHDLMKVLPQISNPEVASLADQWLRGELLGEDDLRALGLAPYIPSEREREDIASKVVQSFLRLAGDQTTLVLCFDEVEAIQAGNWDRAVLREFATMAVTMIGLPGPRVVLTSLRFNLHVDLKQAADITSMQKLATQGPLFMKVIEWEQMLRIVNARLEAEPTCHEERQFHPPGSCWPFERAFLEKFHRENKRLLTPRHVIQACGQEFTRLQEQMDPVIDLTPLSLSPAPPTPSAPPPPPAPPQLARTLTKQLRGAWDESVARFNKLPESLKFDNTFAIGLPWLAHLAQVPFTRSEGDHPGIDDVNLVFYSGQKGKKSLGVTLCNDPPFTLWRRLDRLKKQWKANRGKTLSALHLLRHVGASKPTRAAQDRLDALSDDGVHIHLVPTQTLVELAGYQKLLIEVQQGDLTRPSGKLIDRKEYDDWVKEHFPETQSVKEMLIELFGPLPEPAAKRELATAGVAHA